MLLIDVYKRDSTDMEKARDTTSFAFLLYAISTSLPTLRLYYHLIIISASQL